MSREESRVRKKQRFQDQRQVAQQKELRVQKKKKSGSAKHDEALVWKKKESMAPDDRGKSIRKKERPSSWAK